MSLHFNLKVKTTTIGTMEIRRLVDPEARGKEPADSDQFKYYVYIDDVLLGEVKHRYGDGPWALVYKATMLATFHPSGNWAKPSGVKA